MSQQAHKPDIAREETPVDDVRRVRRQLSIESGGDIRKQIEQSQQFAEQCREKLGLKRAAPPQNRPASGGR